MRLMQGQGGTSLRGIKSAADIPECWGLHGIHQSGEHEAVPPMKNASGDSVTSGTDPEKKRGNLSKANILLEGGGIKIYRPLLPFSKQLLRQTCRYWKSEWVEDKTNKDPSLSPRHALRYLLQEDKLPVALQKPSIIALAERAKASLASNEAKADDLFNSCTITSFAHGTATVRVPKLNELQASNPFVKALCTRRIAELASPNEAIDLQRLSTASENLFSSKPQKVSFTAAGVHFNYETSNPYLNTWHLTRQPYSSKIDPPPTITVPAPSPSSTTRDFILFDGRFWLKVENKLRQPVVIRTLREEDMQYLRSGVDFRPPAKLLGALKAQLPAKSRFTLPVIAEPEEGIGLDAVAGTDGEGNDGGAVKSTSRGRVLALPTFGWKRVKFGLKWEVRYKSVELPSCGVKG